MTALLLVLMFVLTIFMILQYVLQETITGQEDELDELAGEITSLARALGLEQQRVANLEDSEAQLSRDLSTARDQIDSQTALISSLTGQIANQEDELAARAAAIWTFEAQVASLLAERDEALAVGERLSEDVAALEEAQSRILSDQEALQLALAAARDEIDDQAEAARLAAARREVLEALAAELETERNTLQSELSETTSALDEAEALRLADSAAAAALRDRLQNADAELTAMSLALEERRREAEETLTLLAAAQIAESELERRLAEARERGVSLESLLAQSQSNEAALAEQLALAESGVTETERIRALLAVANQSLSQEEAKSAESQRRIAALNEQIAALRGQLGGLQTLLDDAAERDAEAQVQIDALGSQLNTALARVAAEQRELAEEQRRRAELEEAERRRLEAEAEDLEQYRSEFFGQLRELLGDREGVQIVGDRFVFSSEVLFELGSADLALAGQSQIAEVAGILSEVAGLIPPGIDWILRVDGHTDNQPITGGAYASNWELSQARALSVVLFMIDDLGFPPNRLAATGFGEFRPVNEADTAAARAQNRRIELKLTER